MKSWWAAGLVAVGVAAVARAQWQVTVLTPPGVSAASASSIHGDFITGWSGAVHATVWRISDRSSIDLNPAGADQSGVGVSRDGALVGFARFSGLYQAGMWTGWPPVWVNLHPPGARESWISDSFGGVRVGAVVLPNTSDRAAVWMGSPESWVDLTPSGVWSAALGSFRDGIQIGTVDIHNDGVHHASMWMGTAASWVDLNPPGSSDSIAAAIRPDHSVIGWAYAHAGYWRGSAASWVDLNPVGATESAAHAWFGDMLVGEATVNGHLHASIWWRGTSDSWEDISLALNGGWVSSWAGGVWCDGTTLYIVGTAIGQPPNGPFDAVLWTRPLETCYANCDASTATPVLNVNDFVCFMTRFANGESYANCDGSTTPPVLSVQDFVCFQGRFAEGCL